MVWKKNQKSANVYAVVIFGRLGEKRSPGYAQSVRAHTGISREGLWRFDV